MHINLLPLPSKHLLNLPAIYKATCWTQEGGFESLNSTPLPFYHVSKVKWPVNVDFALETEKKQEMATQAFTLEYTSSKTPLPSQCSSDTTPHFLLRVCVCV